MSQFLVLPTPLPASSLTLSQPIANPTNPSTTSFKPSSHPTCQSPQTHYDSQSTATLDESGHFLPTTSHRDFSLRETPIVVRAEASTHISLAKPQEAFKKLCLDTAAQSYLRSSAKHQREVYFVTAIQTLTNTSFQRADVVAEAPARHIRLPIHVKRADSAYGLEVLITPLDDVIFAVELLNVKYRVGHVNEPHSIADLEYGWTYYGVEDGGLQLSIGLGKMLGAGELMDLAGMEIEDCEEGVDWGGGVRCAVNEDGDEGIGGF